MDEPAAPKYNRGRRKAVSAAADKTETTLAEGWKPQVIPKNEEESQRIKSVMAQNILFKFLDDAERDIILNAMFEVNREAGDVIIKQGDEGDNFYVIDHGIAEIFIEKKGAAPLLVLVCKDGDSFGELALMYDAPRAATVIAKTPMKLWAMDRLTYKHILMDTTLKKRGQYKEFLGKIPLLKSLDPYEHLKVADLLEVKEYKDGDEIIREGDQGDAFYIIQNGQVECLQSYEEGKPPGRVATLSDYDYFGERSILLSEPRACTVKAVGDVKVVALDVVGFNMALSPLEDIFKQNIAKYKTYKQLLAEGSVKE